MPRKKQQSIEDKTLSHYQVMADNMYLIKDDVKNLIDMVTAFNSRLDKLETKIEVFDIPKNNKEYLDRLQTTELITAKQGEKLESLKSSGLVAFSILGLAFTILTFYIVVVGK